MDSIFGTESGTLLFLQSCLSIFLAITFLQSGLDKLIDYKGNSSYFQSQFEKSVLRNLITILFPTVLVLEIVTGLTSLAGFFLALSGDNSYIRYGTMLSIITLLSLFFGQRISKDYVGAAGVVPYLIFSFLGLLLFL